MAALTVLLCHCASCSITDTTSTHPSNKQTNRVNAVICECGEAPCTTEVFQASLGILFLKMLHGRWVFKGKKYLWIAVFIQNLWVITERMLMPEECTEQPGFYSTGCCSWKNDLPSFQGGTATITIACLASCSLVISHKKKGTGLYFIGLLYLSTEATQIAIKTISYDLWSWLFLIANLGASRAKA